MMNAYVHTCIRVLDSDRSQRFYALLGYEYRGCFQFDTAYNIYMGLPGGGDTLELTVNHGRTEPYDLGDGYNHIALTVADLDALLAELAEHDILPEKPAFHPGGRQAYRIAFVQDPDGYRGRADRPRRLRHPPGRRPGRVELTVARGPGAGPRARTPRRRAQLRSMISIRYWSGSRTKQMREPPSRIE